MHAAADREEFDVAVEAFEIAADAGDAVPAVLLRFGDHAAIRFEPSLVDHLRDLCYLAAGDVPQSGPEVAQKSERIDAVADHHFAGSQALEPQAVHFIARQTGHHSHGATPFGDLGTGTCGASMTRCRRLFTRSFAARLAKRTRCTTDCRQAYKGR